MEKQKHLSQMGVYRNRKIENMLKPNYIKSINNISLLYVMKFQMYNCTCQDSYLLAFEFIKLLTEKLGKGHIWQMRYIHLFIEYFVYMFVSICVCSWYMNSRLRLHLIMANIGKIFDSEMEIHKNGRSNLFPITYRTLIYNSWAASMRIGNKLEASLWIK